MKNALGLLALIALFLLATTALAFDVHQAKKAVEYAKEGYQLDVNQKSLIEEYELRFQRDLVGTDRAGGPDDYGYAFMDSDEENGPVYSWTDISETGTAITGLTDYDSQGPFDLGITFPFYGQNYTQFWISSDGLINFDGVDVSTSANYEFPSTNGPETIIAWFWDDMHPGYPDASSTYYANTTVDGEDVFVISFIDWREFGGTGTVPENSLSAQMVLFPDGRIQINYDYLGSSLDLSSHSIGIENEDGTIGLTYNYNNANNAPGMDDFAILFYLPVSDAQVSGTVADMGTGSGLAGATVTIGEETVTTDATGNYSFQNLYASGLSHSIIVSASGYYSQIESHFLNSGINDIDFDMDDLPAPNTTSFQTSFEDGEGPFATNCVPDDQAWEFGDPTTDPNGTISGVNAWSINLDGDYITYANDTLVTTQSWLIQSNNASLSYYHWYEYEEDCDGYKVLISTDGGVLWEELVPDVGYPCAEVTGLEGGAGFSGFSRTWTSVFYDLDDYVDQQVWFAFWHGTDLSVNYSGVTIDNLTIDAGVVDATLSGTILDHGTGNPVADATVSALDQTTTTDADGHYSLSDLPSGIIVPFSVLHEDYFTYNLNLMLLTGANTYNVNLVHHPPAIEENFFSDFEEQDDPFVAGPATGENSWEWGAPTVEPGAAYSGSNVWAINLDGDYINNADDTLFTEDSWLIDNDSAFLHYYHWFEYEGTPGGNAYDGYQVLISTDLGESWELLEPDGGYNDQTITALADGPGFTGNQLEWVEVNYSLADYVDESVSFAFRSAADNSNVRSGLAIDDLTINVGFTIPVVTIEEAHFNDDLLESFIQVTGIVVQGSGTTTTNYTDVYIQDNSGWGILLDASTLITGLDRGDELQVVGRLTEWNGIRKLVNFATTELSTGNDLPAPYIGTTVELRNVMVYEGRWVQASGFIQNAGPYGTSATLFIDDGTVEDGTGEMQVRIWSDTGIDLSSYNQYDCITVRGVIDINNGFTQIQPSAPEDIELASPFDAPSNINVQYDVANSVVNVSWTGIDELDETFETFRYYAVYRNNVMIGTVSEGTSFADYLYEYTTNQYNVSAFYDVGESEKSNTYEMEFEHPLWAPVELAYDLDDESGDIELTWEPGGDHGEGVEFLEYDAATPAGAYVWPGNTMATKMTAEGEAQLLALWFATNVITGPREFNAEIYPWSSVNNRPQNDVMFSTAALGGTGHWVQVDLSEENVTVDGNFAVGFGSIDESVGLFYEAEDQNYDRSWDKSNGSWTQSHEPYLIRAIVRYTDGTTATIGPMGTGNTIPFTGEATEERLSMEVPQVTDELDDLVEYTVYRDGEVQGLTYDRLWTDRLPAYDTYEYTIVATYDEGTSEASDPLTIPWTALDENRNGIPEEFAIESAYPNPFNPTINVVVAVPELAKVDAVIYDVLGRQVAIINSQQLKPGYHTFNWTAEGSSGIYFLRVTSDTGWTEMSKLIYMK